MRNYNFRKQAKIKEQEKRKFIYNLGYFPTMPSKNHGINGEEYFIEGKEDIFKQYIKRQASKSTRRYKKGLSNGGSYKKVYNFPYEWY